MKKHLTALALLGLGLSCTTVEPLTENDAAACFDGADNDLDDLTDCDDPSCSATINCQAPPEDCDNGLDDDGDSFIDCVDSQCAQDPSCLISDEFCDNTTDDDQDGLVDCADPDCANDSVCTTGDCPPLPGVIVAPAEQDLLEDTTLGTDLISGTNTGLVQKCGLGSGGGKELVFLFTPANNGTLSLTLTSDTDQGMYVRTTCGDPNSEIACADEFLSTDETISVAVSGGVPLFLFVDAFEDGAEGLFILTTLLQ